MYTLAIAFGIAFHRVRLAMVTKATSVPSTRPRIAASTEIISVVPKPRSILSTYSHVVNSSMMPLIKDISNFLISYVFLYKACIKSCIYRKTDRRQTFLQTHGVRQSVPLTGMILCQDQPTMCFITIFSISVLPSESFTRSSLRTSLIASRSLVLPLVTAIAYCSSTGASSASVSPA